MTAEQQKKPRAEDDWTIEIVIVVAIVLLGVVGAWLAAKIGAPFADAPAPASNPLTFLVAMVKGDYSWPGSPASAVAAGEAVLLGILGTAAYRVVQRFKKKPKVDGAAQHLAKGEELGKLTMKACTLRSLPGRSSKYSSTRVFMPVSGGGLVGSRLQAYIGGRHLQDKQHRDDPAGPVFNGPSEQRCDAYSWGLHAAQPLALRKVRA